MSALDHQFNTINDKLQQLLKQQHHLKRENEKLKEEVDQLKQKQHLSQQTIDELQQNILILKSVTGGLNEKDKKEFEKRLHHYIKEIDKCISFLSQ